MIFVYGLMVLAAAAMGYVAGMLAEKDRVEWDYWALKAEEMQDRLDRSGG